MMTGVTMLRGVTKTIRIKQCIFYIKIIGTFVNTVAYNINIYIYSNEHS